LEHASVEVAEEESANAGPPDTMSPLKSEAESEDLQDYLRRLNPEDFGRFTP
jgi:hypothetical protein